MNKIRRHYRFYGEVQGVGFRWTAQQIARKYGISGWVRNCWDGSVEMEAEGTARDLMCLIDALEHGAYIAIDRIETREIPVQGGYTFSVKHG